MTSAALSEYRPGKRPRPLESSRGAPAMVGISRRVKCDEHKRVLLARGQEKERRHVEEAIRRLEAIEERRRRAKERKLDREHRKNAYAALVERSIVMLQRVERGRQARRVASRRARAVATIFTWRFRNLKRAEMVKAIRNKVVLRIRLEVETMVNNQIEEAVFVVNNVVALQALRHHRSARVIQRMAQERAVLLRHSASVIARAVRYWLARGYLRRSRIRNSILRHPGSLSRRDLGLPEPDPLTLTTPAALLARREITRCGRWWNAGDPIVPRPRNPCVENRGIGPHQRAASLPNLISAGRLGVVGGAGKLQGGHGEACYAPGGSRNTNVVGFGIGTSMKRGASMVDAREAEEAARKAEVARRRERQKALLAASKTKRRMREKSLLRQRKFAEQNDKRKMEGEKGFQWKERSKTQEAGGGSKKNALQAELLRKEEEERDRKRLAKILEFQKMKLAKQLAEKKAAAAKNAQERRENELAEAKRRTVEAAFEKEKARRLERVRRKKRAEEKAKTTEVATPKRWKSKTGKEQPGLCLPASAAIRTEQAAANKSRTVLAPITVGNHTKDRKRRRVRLRGDTMDPSGVRRSRIAPGVRDGRLKPPHGATVPALPVVPDWKAMAAGTGPGERKKARRRPLKGGVGRGGREGRDCAVGAFDGALRSRNASADLERDLPESGGGRGPIGVADKGGVATGSASTPLVETAVGDANAGDAEGQAQEEVGKWRLAEGESPTRQTLYTAFPVPGVGAEIGGGEGLGLTSPPHGLTSEWSRGTSHNSCRDGETTSGSFVSDSAASREGGALFSEAVTATDTETPSSCDCATTRTTPVTPQGDLATDRALLPDVLANSPATKGSGDECKEVPTPFPSEQGEVAGITPAVALNQAENNGEKIPSGQSSVLSSSDGISELSDDRPFVDRVGQENDDISALLSSPITQGGESASVVDGGGDRRLGGGCAGGDIRPFISENQGGARAACGVDVSGLERSFMPDTSQVKGSLGPSSGATSPRENEELKCHCNNGFVTNGGSNHGGSVSQTSTGARMTNGAQPPPSEPDSQEGHAEVTAVLPLPSATISVDSGDDSYAPSTPSGGYRARPSGSTRPWDEETATVAPSIQYEATPSKRAAAGGADTFASVGRSNECGDERDQDISLAKSTPRPTSTGIDIIGTTTTTHERETRRSQPNDGDSIAGNARQRHSAGLGADDATDAHVDGGEGGAPVDFDAMDGREYSDDLVVSSGEASFTEDISIGGGGSPEATADEDSSNSYF